MLCSLDFMIQNFNGIKMDNDYLSSTLQQFKLQRCNWARWTACYYHFLNRVNWGLPAKTKNKFI